MIDPNYVIEIQEKSLTNAMATNPNTGTLILNDAKYSYFQLCKSYLLHDMKIHFTHPVI